MDGGADQEALLDHAGGCVHWLGLRAPCDGADEGSADTGAYAGGDGGGAYAGGAAGWYDTGGGIDGDEPHAGGWLHWLGLRAHCDGADEGGVVAGAYAGGAGAGAYAGVYVGAGTYAGAAGW
uniref:Uncharacterized protein n=1 Tax=Chrysotila carterae TaxID=13221 RepID=A0A7S4BZ89_CHRCT